MKPCLLLPCVALVPYGKFAFPYGKFASIAFQFWFAYTAFELYWLKITEDFWPRTLTSNAQPLPIEFLTLTIDSDISPNSLFVSRGASVNWWTRFCFNYCKSSLVIFENVWSRWLVGIFFNHLSFIVNEYRRVFFYALFQGVSNSTPFSLFSLSWKSLSLSYWAPSLLSVFPNISSFPPSYSSFPLTL